MLFRSVILRPVVLAKLMAGYTTLMVTGTHGETTTTSMLIVALQHSGFDPSFAVGGELGEAGTNAHHGSGRCFVAEADESDGSLLEYTPDVAVVTNIEADHLDFFGSEDAYVAVFDAFVERIAPGGALVVCTDDPGAAALADRTDALGIRVLRYGSAGGADARSALKAGAWVRITNCCRIRDRRTGRSRPISAPRGTDWSPLPMRSSHRSGAGHRLARLAASRRAGSVHHGAEGCRWCST